MAFTGGETAGIAIGVILAIALILFLMLYAFKIWMQGPTKGSENSKKLDGKLVVITGIYNAVGKIIFEINFELV